MNGQKPARGTTADAALRHASLLPGWTAQRLLVDAATGPRVVLIGLLAVGPCITLLTGWWLPAVVTGLWACGLAVLLGLPDGIWVTGTHLAFVSSITIVAAAAAAGAAMIDRAGRRHGTGRLR